MGEPVPISLGLRSNPAREPQAGNARLTNCFAEEHGEDGKVTWVIYATEGLTDFGAALEGGGIRAAIVVNNKLYVVAGRNVHVVLPSGVSTKIGSIPTSGPVYMERNRRVPAQIGIVSGGLYFVINTGSDSLEQINDPDLPGPISLSWLDGYGVLPIANGAFMITALDDFTQIDGLDIGSCEAYPDDIVRSATLEREAVFFGETSIEWHQNTGDPDFPLTRVHAIELGCLSGDSVAKVDTKSRKTLIWAATDHTVRMMNGYSADVISTNDIEKKLKALDVSGSVGTLKAESWSSSGRFFYGLSCDDWTEVYDSKTGLWHSRKSYGLNRWRISMVIPFANKLIAGDYSTGQLYVMSEDVFDEAGNHLVAEVVTPPVHAFPYRLQFNGLYIDVASGVGLNTTSIHAADPKIMVSWSDDGGLSYSAERERSLGRIAQQAQRIQPVYQLGTARAKGREFRFRISAPVKKVLMQVSVDSERLGA